MTTVVSPSLGHGAPFTQLGVGTSPGFDAIDVRRSDSVGISEAPLSMTSYTVAQRAAGANMSVDIAASSGPGVIVQGDHVTQQGRYIIPPHSAPINEVIATADPTNPRIDSIILEIKDSTHDASGLNQAQTRVLTGTPSGGVTLEAPGSSPAALPSSAILLAYVQVDALAASIVTAKVKDMRPKRRGYVLTATGEGTSATSYAYNNLATPDRITQMVVPVGGAIDVTFEALWQNTVASNGRAAIFLGANQIKVPASGAPVVQEAPGNSTINVDAPIGTYGPAATPLSTWTTAASNSTEVTTGQGGLIAARFFVAAGTYDVGVQFKNNGAGTLTVKNRHLWAEVRDFDQCMSS